MGKIKNLNIVTPKILSEKINLFVASDFHIEKEKGLKNLDKLINSPLINYDDIDYILIPGDLINNCADLKDSSFVKMFLDELEKFTKGKPTIVSVGNHDLMENVAPRKWKAGNRFLLSKVLKELPNVKFIKNGEVYRTDEIDFSAFSPNFTYYEGLKENKDVYRDLFNANTNFDAFDKKKYNIFLTHEPHSIIELSKEAGHCIQPNTDLVVSGHMHDGLLPTFLHTNFSNRGLISPQIELFPKYAQGNLNFDDTDYVINGPVNARVEQPLLNDIYGPSATMVTLKKTR